MRSLAIRAALAAVLVIVVNGETFESHSIYPHAIISKKTDTHQPNLQIPEIQEYQDQFDVRKRREADPESNKPRPQQVPPRPPHPRLRREADPESNKPRPQQVPPPDPESNKPRPQQVPPRPPHPRLRREANPESSRIRI
ncbi:hypothetical protein HZH66_005087 [Vespula vulgaris]|uniref:Uncharacterized protein n=1 Tax=Vespula vulgaris TaxID=7454 RepID=A0A834KA97_VESVU|nr:hypothetical protein HZH66_005087 [Vespula vulgaris]